MEQGESSSTFPVFPVTYQPYQLIIKISDFCLDNWTTIVYIGNQTDVIHISKLHRVRDEIRQELKHKYDQVYIEIIPD